MKLLDQDRRDGYMRLEITSDSDLWHLKHVLEPGDRLRMDDVRTTIEGDTKQRCTLTLTAEKTEYTGNRLRATGEIEQAPENIQHGYHTFNIEPGVTFDIWKDEWAEYQIDRITEAVDTKDYEVLVCTIDKESAHLAMITETGIETLSDLESGRSGKMYKTDAASEQEFYAELAAILRDYEDVDTIILAGPGFEKENLADFIADNAETLSETVVTEDVSSVGTSGVQEVIKRGAVKRVLKQSRIADEVGAVEDLLERLNQDSGDCTYGAEQVEDAIEMGAVETLLISEEKVREHEDLMQRVEQMNGRVQIIHEDHDAGKKLAALGGIAALCRYRIE